jgi:hypothetical protein
MHENPHANKRSSHGTPSFWFLIGFAPAQTDPPYWYQYCSAPYLCPVAYGVASIKNFVDCADFADPRLPFRGTPYRPIENNPRVDCAPNAPGWHRKVAGQVFDQYGVAYAQDGVPMTEQVFISSHNDLDLHNLSIGATTTEYDYQAQPPRHGAYGDTFEFCSSLCPSSGETDAIQTLNWQGLPVLHSNLIAYRCGGITVGGN